jgi:phosphoglucosamine mutase
VSLRFGTDGIRGVAGAELTPELMVAVGRAAAGALGGPAFVVGRDTRVSGPMLQAAFSAGVAAAGVDVVDLGVVPTPAVAAVAADRGVPGAVVSASHNRYTDNGIKLFSAGGRKLGDAEEARIEASLASPVPPGGLIASIAGDEAARDWYCRRVVAALAGRRLDGIRVVIDCAHGAASTTAPTVLSAAGAEIVDVLGAAPDGYNINAGCGSTHPSSLAASVVAHGAGCGLAFDGDADRVIAVDGSGAVVDGDRLLALLGMDLRRQGRLAGDTIVVTVMTNLGFRLAMAAAGVAVHETPVGDRYVLEALDANGWSLGGEQSGHVIFRDLATTGDGVLTGLLLLDLLVRDGRPLAALAAGVMERLPQILRNVPVGDRDALATAAPVWDEVRAVEAELGDHGRVLLRPSGTEKLVRVMVEAPTPAAAEAAADRLAAAVTAALGDPAG